MDCTYGYIFNIKKISFDRLCNADSACIGFDISNIILKPLVARTRPYDINTAFELLIPAQHDYSFPSGHSAASFAAVSAMYFTKCSLWKPVVFVAAAIAFSRLYLYVHFPTDVAAGILLGILSGLAAAKIYKRLFLKNREINF